MKNNVKYNFNDLCVAMELACEKKIHNIYSNGELTEERLRTELEASGCTIRELEIEDAPIYIAATFIGRVSFAANELKGIKVPFFYDLHASKSFHKEYDMTRKGTFYGTAGIAKASNPEEMLDVGLLYGEFCDQPDKFDINEFIDENFDLNDYLPNLNR